LDAEGGDVDRFGKHGRTQGRRIALLASLIALLSAATSASAQSVAPQTASLGAFAAPGAPASQTPIRITVEDASTWKQGDDRVYFLQGNLRIEQGTTRISMPRGIVWIDVSRASSGGPEALHIYGEDNILLETAGDTKSGKRGVFALSSTGGVTVKATRGDIKLSNLSNDSMYVRGAEERAKVVAAARQAAGTPDVIHRVQFQAPPPPPDGNLPAPAPGAPGPTPPTFAPSDPPPPPAPPPFFGPAVPAPPLPATQGSQPPRQISVRPRTSELLRAKNYPLPTGETVWVVPSPVIINISDPKNQVGVVDIEADRMVFWTRGDGKELFESMKRPEGDSNQHIEFYLAGNVEMRTKTKKETEILRCDELYYDVSRNVAIGTNADLELRQAKLPFPIHLRSPEIYQLNAKTFQAANAEIFSSELPSDPGLKAYLKTVTVEEREVPRRSIFGTQSYDPVTGEPKVDRIRYFNGNNLLLYLEDVPFFWFPYARGNVEDPLGPLDTIAFGGSNIFGFVFQSGWDMYQLLGIDRPANTRWRLYLDYFSNRGPAAGTEFNTQGTELFGMPTKYNGFLKAFGIYDTGVNGTRTDVLGGGRGEFYFPPPPGTQIPFTHPEWRGRILSRANMQDMPNGFTVQAGLGLISDQNFIEQYFLYEWLTDYNQETFLYLKQQQNQWAWSILAQPHLRGWITEGAFLPRADGWLLGQKLWDNRLTLDVHGSATYAQLRVTDVPQFAYLPTDVNTDLGRFDIWSELAWPVDAGPFRLSPYLVGDIAYYTSNVDGDGQSRFYGGAGLRSSLPLSRQYSDITSEFFNVDGIYHKIVFSTNYLYARSSTSFNNLPQLDRLNDDTTDQAMRDLQVRQIFINPSNAAFLTNVNGLVNPQSYAIRRMIDSRIDTFDSMNVFQFGIDQRWQTRRGIAASEHVVDWITLNVGASLFPQASRDDFGQTWGILEYDTVWNIGDRTSLFSNGWMEPESGGPRVFNVGGLINRPDGTSLSLAYRQIDPLESKAVVGSVAYRFSQKYSASATTIWDFGVNQQTYGLGLTRTGTDLTMTVGLTYNSVLSNLGVQFIIVPNLLRSQIRSAGTAGSPLGFMGGARPQ
jgi:hypothetical protein